ncbi:hypothetical protein HZF05_00740 [Sphingomonas sp. CGMCC 1.13654]|uniref:SMODS and SLOG-associating 2TM effector domain-containing protein n=1 Tax=Sphingomonas chungangi TaxID=2683589 RepID=A0A838L4N4_9SPHN|nr:hypothetical protein [Sphingomonas chungangi]MBA2932608.1 hypothetical protein [Sphingomonas chungangi]MVW56231.1 hypothetical protein [Sphingomonas chungangi]
MSTAILMGGAGAFASLFGESTTFAKIATLLVALIGVVQIVFQVDRCAAEHRRWLKEWMALLLEIRASTDPTPEALNEWDRRRSDVEQECVGELRALQVDCWNRTCVAMGFSAKPTPIPRWQLPLIQICSFEGWYSNPQPAD